MGQMKWISRGRIQVTLTKEEQNEAVRVAHERHLSQRQTGRVDFKARPQDDGRMLDLLGSLAEQAVASAFGLPWDGKFKPIAEWDVWRRAGHDVSGLEVKSTKRYNGSLILHRESRPELPAVLVIIESSSSFKLVGWTFTKEGQQERFWREKPDVPESCFMVPQSYLKTMTDLFMLLGLDVPEPEKEVTAEELEQLLSTV